MLEIVRKKNLKKTFKGSTKGKTFLSSSQKQEE